MAVPARKTSKARRDKRRSNVWKMERRSNVWKMDAPELVRCPQCGAYKRPHRVCLECGYYNGRKVIEKD